MMISFKNSIVLITGGGSGIGLALAKEFIGEGATVIICGRNQEKLEAASKEISGLQSVPCDVTSKEDCTRLLHGIDAQFGRLDVLINNAGIYARHEFFSDEFIPKTPSASCARISSLRSGLRTWLCRCCASPVNPSSST